MQVSFEIQKLKELQILSCDGDTDSSLRSLACEGENTGWIFLNHKDNSQYFQSVSNTDRLCA